MDIMERIDALNKRARELNAERERAIGRKEALELKLQNLVAKYKQEYGVEVTEENLEEVGNEVMQRYQAKANALDNIIQLADNGDFAGATEMIKEFVSGGVVSVTEGNEPVVETPTVNTSEVPTSGVAQNAPTPTVNTSEVAQATPVVNKEVQAVPTPTAVPEPVEEVQKPTVSTETPTVPEQGVAPAGVQVGTPNPSPFVISGGSVTEPKKVEHEVDAITGSTNPFTKTYTAPSADTEGAFLEGLGGTPIANVADTSEPIAKDDKPAAPPSFSSVLGGSPFGV